MTQTVMAGDMTFLPEEMIRNILMRLPVKSLLRFRCVCKNWRNLIKTPYFISEHLHHSTQQNPSLLFQRNDLRLLDCKMQFLKVGEVPLIKSLNRYPLIVCSSNGLLCFDVHRHSRFSPIILLWNPATREFKQVRPIRRGVDLGFHIGFGFSQIVNDYKIVLAYQSNNAYLFNDGEVAYVEVYSLRSGSWKEVEFGIENVGLFSHQTTVNGAIFWFGFGREPDTSTYYVIVSFDIANEVFSLIPTPDRFDPRSRSSFAVHENKLALLTFSPTQGSESLINLWVTEGGIDAFWVKKYSYLIPFVARPLTIWMNQIVITNEGLWWNDKLEIALLNISTNHLKRFDIRGCGVGFHSGFAVQHAESLSPIFG